MKRLGAALLMMIVLAGLAGSAHQGRGTTPAAPAPQGRGANPAPAQPGGDAEIPTALRKSVDMPWPPMHIYFAVD